MLKVAHQRAFWLLVTLMVFTVAPRTMAAEQVLDRILVVVNDDVITESEFFNAYQRAVSEIRFSRKAMPDQAELERDVMENLILERIQLQIADRYGISVSETQIDRAINDIASRQNATPRQLLQRVRESGISIGEYRQNIARQVRIQRVIDREVRRKLVISESEIDAWIANQQANSNDSDIEYEVAHITLAADQARQAEVEQLAASVVEKIESGEEFSSLARQYSDAPDAEQGGYLGWRSADSLPNLFVDAIRALDVGFTTGVLQSPNGFHILKLIDRRGGGRYVVDQWKARHILVAVDGSTSVQEAAENIRLLRERIEQGESFEELAKVHSDDTQSRVNGGELGWLSPGETVPEFEEALRNLSTDELSGPVRSAFGVHLIHLQDRRKHDIGNNRLRRQAEEALRNEIGRQAYDQWIERIRAEAFVKFRVKPG